MMDIKIIEIKDSGLSGSLDKISIQFVLPFAHTLQTYSCPELSERVGERGTSSKQRVWEGHWLGSEVNVESAGANFRNRGWGRRVIRQ